MNRKLFTILTVLTFTILLGANASTQPFNDSQNVTRLGSTFTFSQFNPSLGTLTAVDLIVDYSVPGGNFSVSRGATGTASTNGTVSLFTQKLSIEDPDGNIIFTGPTQSLTFSGINSIPRSTTRVFTINPSQSLLTITPSNPASVGSSPWTTFIGSGNIELLASFTPEATFTPGLGITADYNNLTAPTSMTLRYTYDSTVPIPEPGQVAASLLLLGGIGTYVFIKRRKKSAPAAA